VYRVCAAFSGEIRRAETGGGEGSIAGRGTGESKPMTGSRTSTPPSDGLRDESVLVVLADGVSDPSLGTGKVERDRRSVMASDANHRVNAAKRREKPAWSPKGLRVRS
jgi:hypothetical protein